MEKKRIVWVDYARAFAILCVVLCHAVETYYRSTINGEEVIPTGQWMMQNTLFTLGRMGVPIFLALTGVLMLDRVLDLRTFYITHLLPLFLTTEVWIVLNYWFITWERELEFDGSALLRQMFFVESGHMGHMWYMPMILSIYVIMPFLSWIMDHRKRMTEFRLWFWLGFLSMVAAPTVNVILKAAFPEIPTLDVRVDTSSLGGLYILYIYMGWRLGREELFAKVHWLAVTLLGLAAFILNCLGQRYLYEYETTAGNSRLLSYSSAGIFIAGLCLVDLFRRMFKNKEKCGWFCRSLANSSFGIFLLHKPIQVYLSEKHMDLFLDYYNLKDDVGLKTLLLFVVSFVISYVVVIMVTLICPPIAKVLFYAKSLYKPKEREKRSIHARRAEEPAPSDNGGGTEDPERGVTD